MTIKCPKCHEENPDTVKFCGECGTQLIPSARNIRPEVTETLQTAVWELTTGSTFAGRYQVIEELGKGGMGKVYRVLDKKLKEEVALKLIKSEIASDKETIERFSNELKLARRIGHRNVGRMYELMEAEGTYFITMEYVSGEDLKSFIHRVGQLPAGKAISVAMQVSDGLAEAHRLGVVHRDLKPSNIMIDKDGNARIMDFGIARSISVKGITGAGVMIGTPEYMSPEQVEGKEADQRSDIYSLGVILYQMVTGRVPFEGDTPLSVAVKQKTEAPRNPRTINPQVPEDLSRAILRCLEKDKEKRYQTAEEVLADLENIEKGIPTTERIIPKKERLTSREITVKFRLRKLLIPALVFLGLVAAGIVLWRVLPKKEAAPAASAKKSVAVLSFADLSPAKDREYLCDGIAETLINALSRIEELRVPAATSAFSFKGKGADIKEIGQKLAVETVLEGSIQIAGDRLRVNAQLINVNDGYHLWSEKYDRGLEDVFAVQDDIAQKIVGALKIELLGERETQVVKLYTENREAYDLYMQGLYFYNKRRGDTLAKAVDCYLGAIKKDPAYALAFAQLAETYQTIGSWGQRPPREVFPQAKQAAQKALEMDNLLAEAHCALAGVKYMFDWDWEGAEKEYQLAMAMNPRYAIAFKNYGEFLTMQRRFDEARKAFNKARELDPLSLIILAQTAWPLRYSGQYDLAIEQFKKVLEIDPDFAPAQSYLYDTLAMKYMAEGRYEEILEDSQRSNDLVGTAMALSRLGKKKEARELLDNLIAEAGHYPQASWTISQLFFALGENDPGFQWLEKAYAYKYHMLAWLKIDTRFDSVRDDPRFIDMLKRVGLQK